MFQHDHRHRVARGVLKVGRGSPQPPVHHLHARQRRRRLPGRRGHVREQRMRPIVGGVAAGHQVGGDRARLEGLHECLILSLVELAHAGTSISVSSWSLKGPAPAGPPNRCTMGAPVYPVGSTGAASRHGTVISRRCNGPAVTRATSTSPATPKINSPPSRYPGPASSASPGNRTPNGSPAYNSSTK